MTYHFRRKEPSVQASLCAVAHAQVGKAIAEIDDPALDVHETVHQVRKRCKKVRGLIRLVRPAFPAYAAENKAFRDAARTLSFVRDAEALTETYDELCDAHADRIDRARFASIRRAMTHRKKALADDGRLDHRLAAFRREMTAAQSRIDHWTVAEDGFDAVAAGLVKTYKRARKAMATAVKEPTAGNVHEWRKWAKYHWYHARLLREIWPDVVEPHRDAADALGDLLGDHHDLAVLRAALADAPATYGDAESVAAFRRLAKERQAALLAEAIRLGHRLFAEKPKAIRKRFRAYWQEWKAPSAAVALAA